jgi:hypothetical protein
LECFLPVLALTASHVTLAAASPSAKLTYVRGPGAETCPDESELRRAVATRLGYDPFFPAASKTVVAEIRAHAPRGFRGVVQIIDEHGIVRGERTLETQSADCAEMVRALALGISIAIDDLDATSSPAPPEPAPSPPVSEPPAPSPAITPWVSAGEANATSTDESPAVRGAAARSSSLQVEAAVGGRGSLGLGPAPSVGLTIGFGITSRTVSLRLEGTRELPSSESLGLGGRISTSFLVASLVPCLRPGVLFACATASLGSFRGGTLDIASPRSASTFFAMVGARGGVLVPLYAMFSLAPHADVAVPLLRHSVAVDGRTVYTAPSIGGALGLDVEARFP